MAYGDVNGDGKADIVVGAPIGSEVKSGRIDRPGYVRVFDGNNPSVMLYEFTGTQAGDRFGWRVATGDVNGDGKADIVVSSLTFSPSQTLEAAGRITIFSGADGSIIRAIDGLTKTEQLGESLALADINGDGKADLLAGAWSFDPGTAGARNKNNGIVRLYDGATGAILWEHVGALRDIGLQDEMGRAVAFGDVNGDGILDFILGAGGGQGYVEVISGADRATQLYLFRGDLSVGNEDQFGRAVAAVDLNGDGKAEVIAAAHVGDGGGLADSGWVRVFNGATGILLHQFNGSAAQDHFGKSVAVGDVNGDGQPDIVVGAEWGTLLGTPPGSGYVRAFDGVTFATLFEFNGSCNSDHLGQSVAVRGFDVSGRANVLTGAEAGDANAVLDSGYARLYQDQ